MFQKTSCSHSATIAIIIHGNKANKQKGKKNLVAISICTNLEEHLKKWKGENKVTIIHTGREINRKWLDKYPLLSNCDWSECILKNIVRKSLFTIPLEIPCRRSFHSSVPSPDKFSNATQGIYRKRMENSFGNYHCDVICTRGLE